ncbi:MAG: murein transglycosylase A [Thermodesulfobacteriota bacterium]
MFNNSHLKRFCLLLAIILSVQLFLSGCGRKPLYRLESSESVLMPDDLDNASLLSASVRHLHYLKRLPEHRVIAFENDHYPLSWLITSLESFIDILKQDPAPKELARIIAENYTLYQAGGRENGPRGKMLITGYYEPLLEGSLVRQAPFLHPIYGVPDNLVIYKDGQDNKQTSGRRNDQGEIVPYWSRAEIEKQNHAAGFELVYLKSPLDSFILHVQGSGRIKLRDGTIRSIHYAASNSRQYNSIGKLLVDQNKMTLEEVSMVTIKEYLDNHPEEQEAIFHHNEKFNFFKWEKGGGPIGGLGEILTSGRSIAIDPDILPMEAPAFLISAKPIVTDNGTVVSWRPMSRFVLPQDKGAAIKGSGRCDLFWGNSPYAKAAAGSMKESGKLYFLVKNNFEYRDRK